MKTNLQKDLETLNAELVQHIDSYFELTKERFKDNLEYLKTSVMDENRNVSFDEVADTLERLANDVNGFYDHDGISNFKSEYDLNSAFESIIENNELELKDEDSDFHHSVRETIEEAARMFNLTDNETYANDIIRVLEREFNIDFKKLVRATRF